MLSRDERALLEAALGRSGIYIEKGRYEKGQLKAFFEDGDLLTIRLDTSDDASPFDLSSTSYEVSPNVIAAFGYISWCWIYADAVILEIEARIDTSGATEEAARYRAARHVVAEMRRIS